MDNFDLRKFLAENKLNEENKGAMYQLIKLRDIENPYNLHRDLISSLNRFARATVAKEQGYQGFGLDNELQLTRLDVNNQAAFHKLDREEVKDTLKRALELYRSGLKEQDVKTKMTDFGPIDVPNTKKYIKRDITDVKPGDIITHDETGKEYEVQDLIGKAHRLQSNKLKVVDTEGNVRVINPYKYSIKESLNEGFEKSAIQNALKNNGYNLKQKDFKVSSKKRGNITHYYLNGEEIGNSEYNYDEFISKATKRIKEDPKKYGLNESLNEGKAYKTVTDKDGNTFKPGRKYKTQYGIATFIKFSPDGKIIHLKSDKMGDVKTSVDNANKMELLDQVKVNEGKGRDEARKIIDHLRSKVFKKLNDDELDEFRKEIANAFDIKESVNEDIQSELDKWEGRLYDLENMTRSSNNPDPIKQKKAIEDVKKKIASLKKKSKMNEIKGFGEFKETGFKLGDKVKFMGSAHPTHTKPIKLTGTIEYFEPADEIGVRVDGYGAFIPFFEIPSSVELIDQVKVNEDVESGKVYVVIPFYLDGSTINENDVRVFTSYDKADNYFNTLQGSPIIIDTSID